MVLMVVINTKIKSNLKWKTHNRRLNLEFTQCHIRKIKINEELKTLKLCTLQIMKNSKR